MQIRPIHTPADHEAALAEVERLWEAEAGSSEPDRLEVLATLVEGARPGTSRSIHRTRSMPCSSAWSSSAFAAGTSSRSSALGRGCPRS